MAKMIKKEIRAVPGKKLPKKTNSVRKKDIDALDADASSAVAVDSIDWGDIKLTERQKLFAFWYTYPPLHRSASEAIRRAGYKVSVVSCSFQLLHNPEVQRAIRMLDAKYNRVTIDEMYQQMLARKMARLNFKGGDFYIFKGGKAVIKDYEDLTDEQKMCVDGISYESGKGISNYILPRRKDEEASVMALHSKLYDSKDDRAKFDVETTVDIIRGSLQVKTRLIQSNEEITAASDLNVRSAERSEED